MEGTCRIFPSANNIQVQVEIKCMTSSPVTEHKERIGGIFHIAKKTFY